MVAGKKEEGEVEEFKMAEIKVLNQSNEKISFLLKDSSPAYSNALRRIILTEVPVLAIEDVEFRQNSSALYDEIIAHRLGLMPLTTDLKSYEFMQECKCNGTGCAKCTLKLTIKEKGPKTVYASSLKSADPKVKPVLPKTPIVRLLKDQVLELEATAVLGKGKEHSKWSPCHVFYKIMPNVSINQKEIKNPEAIAESCPVSVFEVKSNKLTINDNNLLKCHLCNACVDISKGAVQLDNTEKDYYFNLEPWGQLSPKEILLEAVQILDNKLEELDKKI